MILLPIIREQALAQNNSPGERLQLHQVSHQIYKYLVVLSCLIIFIAFLYL